MMSIAPHLSKPAGQAWLRYFRLHYPQPRAFSQAGFTLIELVLALAIFAVLSIMAYSALRTVLNTRDHVERQMTRLAELQAFFNILGRDIEQTTARPVRNELGEIEPAVKGGSGDNGQLLALTRTGWSNPLNRPRSSLVRVAYAFDNNKIIKKTWNTLDRIEDKVTYEDVLLDRVTNVEFRYLSEGMEWMDAWPPEPANNQDENEEKKDIAMKRPRGIEINIEFEDMGKITRLYQAGTIWWPEK